jgi:hypothetical protein
LTKASRVRVSISLRPIDDLLGYGVGADILGIIAQQVFQAVAGTPIGSPRRHNANLTLRQIASAFAKTKALAAQQPPRPNNQPRCAKFSDNH